jgi:hypothetical protein
MMFEQPINKKEKLIEQIVSLTHQSGVTLKEIAGILGAEQFLSYDSRRKVHHFDARQYIEARMREEKIVLVPDKVENLQQVILTPGAGEIIPGSGEGIEKKEIIPRTKFLIELLSAMDLSFEVLDGIVKPNMMRKESYKIFIIPKIGKAVFVNNEEGNATRVLHEFSDKEAILKMSELTKEELDALPSIESIDYTGEEKSWKTRIKSSLQIKNFIKFVSLETQTVEEEHKERSQAPVGWFTARKLINSLKVASETIKSFVEAYRTDHPAWFRNFMSGVQYVEHYHPDLVKIINEKFDKRELRPVGWLTANELMKELKVNYYDVKGSVEVYRAEHPEWFKNFMSGPWYVEHYHPDLVRILHEKFGQREESPAGWFTAKKLKNSLKVSREIIVSTVEAYRAEHPEWFKNFMSGPWHVEHYHPDLVRILHEKFGQRAESPVGWFTAEKLSNSMKLSVKTIKSFVESYRADHPEWLKNFTSGPFYIEHYHPDLVMILQKKFGQREKSPVGWFTANKISKSLKLSSETI